MINPSFNLSGLLTAAKGPVDDGL